MVLLKILNNILQSFKHTKENHKKLETKMRHMKFYFLNDFLEKNSCTFLELQHSLNPHNDRRTLVLSFLKKQIISQA